MQPIHLSLMLLAVVAWGVNFVVTRVALEAFSPLQLTFARSVLTLLLLLPWWRPFQRIPARLMLAALVIGTVSFYLLNLAISLTDSLTTVAVTSQLMPPLSAILATVFYRERTGARKWIGILVATAGAIYLAGVTESVLSLQAMGITVLSVLLYAAGTIVIGKDDAVDVWRMLAWISAVSVLPLGALTALSGPLLPDVGSLQARHWSALIYAAVFSALFGQAVLLQLYRRYPVSAVAPWMLLVPLVAGLTAAAVYGESITSGLVIGGGIVLLGVWLQQRGQAR
jgi:O-acetylserine/cysteine efflux transporter